MTQLFKRVLLVSASVIAIPYGAAVAQNSTGATTASQADTGITEVVVTAQRREERAQTVPISITSFSNERLQQQNIGQPQDLQGSVPSLTVSAVGQASRDVQSFTLRGQGSTFQASPGVVVYFNEVPLPSPITLSQQGGPGNFIDLENLQVLSGPQGTLFGRNTTGGAVLLVPHKPTNDFSGSLQAKYGNYNDTELEGFINIPVISDKLLVRAAGGYRDRDGFTQDVVHHKDLDNVHWYSGRLAITIRPSDTLENDILAYGAEARYHGTSEINQGFNIPGLQGVGFCVDPPLTPPGPSGIAVSCNYYRDLTKQAEALGPRATAPSVNPGQTTQTYGIMNTTRFDLNDELTLRNIVSYQQFNSHYYYDGDGTTAQQYDAGLPSNPLPRDYIEDITEEFQLQGNLLDKHLVFTTGFFYYDQRPAGAQGVSAIIYCPALFTGFCGAQQASVAVENQSEAVYAQATLDFGAFAPDLEGLKLTGGYRYTWDTIDGSAYSYSPATTGGYICSSTSVVVASNPTTACSFSATLHSSAPNWNVGLDYRLMDSILFYGKISRGYKAGGFNSYSVYPDTRTFDPEYVTSYEVGAKSDFKLGNMPVRLNGDYYFLNYENIQRASGDFNPVTRASGARVQSAKAEIQGVELEATIRPFQQLEIGGSFSYTDFKYTDYHIPSNGILPDCSGSVPPPGSAANLNCLAGAGVAPYIFNVHATFTQPLPNDLGELSLFVNYAHQSTTHSEAVVIPPNQPGEAFAPFGLLNISLDWNNIAGSGVDAGFWTTNATNELYRISNTDVFQIGSLLSRATIYGEPAMYGVRLRYRFDGQSEPEAAPTAYVPPPVQAPAPAPKSYLVFFDFNKSDLTSQAVEIVDTAAKNATGNKVTQISVTGHTDTVGSDAYNMRLSRRRAESVAAQLEKDGIPSSEIAIVAKGKRDLLVPTKDGVREPQNRRVQIVFDNGPNA